MSKIKLSAMLLCSTLLVTGCDKAPNAATPFELAKRDFEQAHYAESLLHIKRAVQLEPNRADARVLMAEILLEVGDPFEAIRHINKAQELGVARQEYVILQAKSLIKQKKYDELLDKITIDADLMSLSAEEQAEIYALRGQAQIGKNQPQDSLSSFRRALSLSDNNSRAYVGLSTLSFQERDFPQAERYLQHAFDLEPNNRDAYALQGDFARIQGELEKAEKAYGQVIEHSYPTSIEAQHARLYRALVRAYQDDFDGAWKDVRKIKVISGENIYTDYVSGVIAFQAKEYDKAQSSLEKVLGVFPDHLFAHFLLGSVHFMNNQPRQAREHLVYFVNEAPDSDIAQKMLAMTEFHLGEPNQAILRLNELLEDNPADTQALNLLGQHYLAVGEARKGLSMLERSISQNPRSEGAQIRFGLGHMDLGEYDIAEKAFQQALTINKDNRPAQYYQLLSFLKKGEPNKTIGLADKLLADNANNLLALNFKGIAFVSLDKIDEAVAQFNKVLEKHEGDPTAHFNLANLALKDANKTKAKKHLDAVVKHNPKLIRGYLKQAHLAIKENDAQQAENWLLKAREQAPQDIQTNLALSKLYTIQDRVNEGLEVLVGLEDATKQNNQILFALAQLYAKTKQYAQAQQALTQLEQKFPAVVQAAEFQALQATLYTREGQFEKASHLYQQLQQSVPSQRWVVALASSQWESNNKSNAIATLENWLNDNPKDSIAQIALANYFMLAKDDDKALHAFYKAENLLPNHPFVLNNIAWILKDSDVNKAYEYAERAITLSSDENIKHTFEVVSEKKKAVN